MSVYLHDKLSHVCVFVRVGYTRALQCVRVCVRDSGVTSTSAFPCACVCICVFTCVKACVYTIVSATVCVHVCVQQKGSCA